MKKKLNLTFAGLMEIRDYGVFLGGKLLSGIISQSMLEGKGENFLGRVTVTIECMEDVGLNVEVK